jgi:hypothetical protein
MHSTIYLLDPQDNSFDQWFETIALLALEAGKCVRFVLTDWAISDFNHVLVTTLLPA